MQKTSLTVLLVSLLLSLTNCKKESGVQILDENHKTLNSSFDLPTFIVSDEYLVVSHSYSVSENTRMSGLTIFRFNEDKFEPIRKLLDWNYDNSNHVLFIKDNAIATLTNKIGFSGVNLYTLPVTTLIQSHEADRLYLSDDKLLLSNGKEVRVHSMKNNDTLWIRKNLNLIFKRSEKSMVFAANDSVLMALDEGNGNVIWETRLEDRYRKDRNNQIMGDKFLLNDTTGFSLYDLSNGNMIWSISDYSIGSKVLEDKQHYFVQLQHKVYVETKLGAVDKMSGEIKWVSEPFTENSTAPYLHNDTIIIADEYGDNLLLFDVYSGSLIKKIPLSTSGYAFYKDEYLIYGSPAGGVYQVKLEDILD